MTLKRDAKFEKKLTCNLGNDMNLANFYQSTWRSQNQDSDEILLSKVENVCISLKFTEELRIIKMKNDARFDDEMTCHFKIDMRNWTNFDQSTQRPQIFAL